MKTEALTCEDIERLGLWQTRRCCPGCHSDIARGEAHIDIEPDFNRNGRPSRVKLVVCCNFYPARDAALDRALFARALRARKVFREKCRALAAKRPLSEAGLPRLAPVLRLARANAS